MGEQRYCPVCKCPLFENDENNDEFICNDCGNEYRLNELKEEEKN